MPETALTIDLLNTSLLSELRAYPEHLYSMVQPAFKDGKWVLIDEVQKISALLDLVHQLIEKENVKFSLTGSSARKLKRGAANLLAGRAFVYRLFPLLPSELGDYFDLDQALTWGTLPKIFEFETDIKRSLFLQSYVETYLQEEIVAE